MKIARITLTGADDAVSHEALADLARDFPFLEIGVLYSRNKSGQNRYPTDGWRQLLFKHVEARRVSIHLCGDASRLAMAGIVPNLPNIPPGCRLQLNGFSRWRLPALLIAHGRPDLQVILQCDGSQQAINSALHLRSVHSNVVALIDGSGGSGIFQPKAWPAPPGDLRFGYAGGIKAENLELAFAAVAAIPARGETWIDIETGCRDNEDRFDMTKARSFLELAASLLLRPPA